MGDSPVKLGLIRKRAELAGEVMKVRAHLERLEADLAAVDRVLDITGFDGDPDAIPAKGRNTLHERDEANRVQFTLAMLKTASKPLRASTIARAYMAETKVVGAGSSNRRVLSVQGGQCPAIHAQEGRHGDAGEEHGGDVEVGRDLTPFAVCRAGKPRCPDHGNAPYGNKHRTI